MSHIRVLICRVDDPSSDTMTELAAFDLPAPDVTALQPETALDQLEATTQTTGHAILRRLLQAEWGSAHNRWVKRLRPTAAPRPRPNSGPSRRSA